METLDLHELRVFLAAADTENFSEAGRRLNISQPAVSMQIRSLEDALDIQLFHRTGRHIMLTEAGHHLIPMARDLINRAAQIEENMMSLQGNIIGSLKLGCSVVAGRYVLAKLVYKLRGQHPQVQVICNFTSHSQALQMLLEGEVQIALTGYPEPHKEIEYQPFLIDRTVLLAPVNHPWVSAGEPIKPSSLLDAEFVMYPDHTPEYNMLRAALAEHNVGIDSLKAGMIVSCYEGASKAVREAIGAAFVSEAVAVEAVQLGLASVVEIKGMDISRTLYLAQHVKRPATMAQAAFMGLAFEEPADEQLPGQMLIPTL